MKKRIFCLWTLAFVFSQGCFDAGEESANGDDTQSDVEGVDTGGNDSDSSVEPVICDAGTVNVAEKCVVALAVAQATPSSIAVDETHVYWTNEGTFDSLNNYNDDGSVSRVLKSGGVVEKLALDLLMPTEIQVDDTHVYWVQAAVGWRGIEGAVFRVSKSGGDPEAVAQSSTAINGLSMTAEELFWIEELNDGTDNQEITTRPKDLLAEAASIYSVTDCYGMIVEGEKLYWIRTISNAQTASIYTAPIDGSSAPVELFSAGDVARIAVDSNSLYWADNFSGETVPIYKRDLGGSASRKTLSVERGCNPNSLIADDQHIFWTVENCDGALTDFRTLTAPVDPGPTTVLIEGTYAFEGIAIDAASVYGMTDSQIVKLSK